jgi:O-antigen/teichoic acid export membrane protein
MVINVALNWVLIPIYGIEGAAVATLIAYLFSAYFANWLYKDMRPIFKMETSALLLNMNLKRLYGNK